MNVIVSLIVLVAPQEGVPPGGGPVSNGLKVILSADRNEVGSGDQVTFKATLWNLKAEAQAVALGTDQGGIELETGMALETQEQASVRHAKGLVGLCGTNMEVIVHVIPPLGSRSYKAVATFRPRGSPPVKGVGGLTQHSTGPEAHFLFKDGWLPFEARKGEQRMRVRIVRVKDPVWNLPEVKGVDPAIPRWTGELLSNEVTVALRGE